MGLRVEWGHKKTSIAFEGNGGSGTDVCNRREKRAGRAAQAFAAGRPITAVHRLLTPTTGDSLFRLAGLN
jgi:hypothetical protein